MKEEADFDMTFQSELQLAVYGFQEVVSYVYYYHIMIIHQCVIEYGFSLLYLYFI